MNANQLLSFFFLCTVGGVLFFSAVVRCCGRLKSLCSICHLAVVRCLPILESVPALLIGCFSSSQRTTTMNNTALSLLLYLASTRNLSAGFAGYDPFEVSVRGVLPIAANVST